MYEMYGLAVRTEMQFAGLSPSTRARTGTRSVTVELAPLHVLERQFSGPTDDVVRLSVGASETIDVEVGRQEDALMRYGEHATFFVSADGAQILCAPQDPDSPAWRRVLLDTVLGTSARCQGLEGLHAGAVKVGGHAVAIAAPTGGGKSTLCAELVRREAQFLADDMVFLSRDGERILAHPGPPLMNLPVGRFPPGAVGYRLALFGDEEWVAVRNFTGRSAPLAAVILLERVSTHQGARLRPDTSGKSLLTIALDTGPLPERLRARFELLGQLSDTARVLRLEAGRDEPPEALAALVESALGASTATA